MKLNNINLYFIVFFLLWCTIGNSQDRNILKSATEFRNIILEEYVGNFQSIEKIRLKLDSLNIDDNTFKEFCTYLNYVSNNLHNEVLENRQGVVEALKSNRVYMNLDEDELSTVLDNLSLIFMSKDGIWEERYPHKLDANSLRLKELGAYEIENNDRILYYLGSNDHISEILYLSYDSLDISFIPFQYLKAEKRIFEVIESRRDTIFASLNYLPENISRKTDFKKFDKIIFSGLHILYFTDNSYLKKGLRFIHDNLKPEGEMIMSSTINNKSFDGFEPSIEELDRRVETILKNGFTIKERIYTEDEFIVYKFMKLEEK